MKIVCPHCSFTREVPDSQVPERLVKVTCPKCRQGFNFDKAAAAAAVLDADFGEPLVGAAENSEAATPERATCPACGLEQPPGESCAGCGVVYAKWARRRDALQQPAETEPPHQPEPAFPGRAAYVAAETPADLPKAGFWIRAVAAMIDGLLLSTVQFALSLALGLAGGYGEGESFSVIAITWLCSMAVSVTYYVFFTGYNGQTPGKMALRIQVVRCDGTPMSYGRAFLREIVGKFVSSIILGIGYLMVAFDRDKQGLHDKIAGTYVIKL
jgi:predicted Zn finger-like uncharacterized protein